MAKSTSRRSSHRLANTVVPSDYRIHIDVDPARSKRFSGEVEIDLHISTTVPEIILNAADLALTKARLLSDGEGLALSIELAAAEERAVLRAPRPVKAGRYRLTIAFKGLLRSDLRGLYAATSGEHRFAFTQLEAADARRVFPCFDEPAFKAHFSLSVTTGSQQTVVSNMAEQSTVMRDGRKTVSFLPTPLLSTYLLALAVGPLQASKVMHAGDTPIRVYHAPGGARLTGFGLQVAHDCLLRLENYFGLPYPYGKLDLLAVPDFEIGAMENAGAVFFRETLLLLDERSAALPEKKRAAEVICHELAHMWFGNLVTMAWWDDLWLNEAFATWMAFAIVDELRPEWQMWNDFLHGRNAALELDALRHTHAVYTEVRTPAEATENFDLITYEKGAAVVRMLERYLGKETFRAGVQRYIRKHREGNAVAADLWNALQTESKQRGLSEMIRSWVSTKGFPLVRLSRVTRAGKRHLLLSQEPFRAAGPSRAESKPAQAWTVPWVGCLGGEGGVRECRASLGAAPLKVTLDADVEFIYGNADEGGFFRPWHEPAELRALSTHLEQLRGTERLGLISHGFSLTHAGYGELPDYLALLWAFAKETDPDVLSALVSPLEQILAACPSPAAEQGLRSAVVSAFLPALHEVGLTVRRGEAERTRLRRAALYDLAARVGRDPGLLRDARERAQDYLGDARSVEANLAGPAVLAAACQGDRGLFERYRLASMEAETPQQRRLFRLSLAGFEDASLVRALHQEYGRPTIPTQDVAIVVVRQLHNQKAQLATWNYVTKRWDTLRKRLTPMLAARLISGTSALPAGMASEVVDFFKSHPVPTAQRTLQQVQERFKHKAAFQKRSRATLAALAR